MSLVQVVPRDTLRLKRWNITEATFIRRKRRTGLETEVKSVRNSLEKNVTAYEFRSDVKMQAILNHKSMPVPLSLAVIISHNLRTGNKSF